MQTIKWAVLGTGYIANSFAEAMHTVKPVPYYGETGVIIFEDCPKGP